MLFEGLYHPLEYDSRWDEGEGWGGGGVGREGKRWTLCGSHQYTLMINSDCVFECHSLETTKELCRNTLTRTENGKIERYDRNSWLFFRDT